jgi:DNA-binding GntR family transcriptional regulator
MSRASAITGELRPSEFARIETATMHHQVYEEIKRQIMAGRFRPGETFSMQYLASALGTSTTPVREAIRRLAAENAVDVRPKRAVMIPQMSRERFDEIGAVRVALESMATERAAQHITAADIEACERLAEEAETARLDRDMKLYLAKNQEFHFRIYRSAQTLILMPIIESLWLQIGPVQALHTDTGISFGSECHYVIINALRQRDARTAREAMAEDIDTGIRYLRGNVRFFET